MTPVPTPVTRTAWSDEPPNPSRQEYRARTHIVIHSLTVAAYVASRGHEVTSHIDTHGSRRRVYWMAPPAAQAEMRRYQETLNALSRAMRSQLDRAHAPKVDENAPQASR